jgi:hypothetical protein
MSPALMMMMVADNVSTFLTCERKLDQKKVSKGENKIDKQNQFLVKMQNYFVANAN